MLATQKIYLGFLNELGELINNAKDFPLVEAPEKLKEIKGWRDSIAKQELLVPIVGGFSVGKSTLLNDFLGENILSVGLTPETALATELRYTDSESHFIAVKENGTEEKIALKDSEILKTRAQEFEYCKLYLNHPKLKDIQPLILVDMPGFDAPIEAHNKAISNYLQKGVYYIILESIDKGTIASSIKSQIDILVAYNRDFSFCLSKTNLISPQEVEEVANGIREELEIDFNYNKPIALFKQGAENQALFESLLKDLNAENIFQKLYKDHLYALAQKFSSSFHTCMQGLEQDKESANEEIKELQQSINALQDSPIDDTIFNAQEATQDTLKAVENAISNQIASLANLAAKNQQSFHNSLGNIIQNTLISEIAYKTRSNIDSVIKAYKEELSANPAISYKEEYGNLIASIERTIKSVVFDVQSNEGTLRAVAGVLDAGSVLALKIPGYGLIVGAILKLIGKFLPSFASKSVDPQELLTQILSQVRSAVEPKLSNHYESSFSTLKKAVESSITQALKQKQQEIVKAQGEKQNKTLEIGTQIETLKQLCQDIESLLKLKLN